MADTEFEVNIGWSEQWEPLFHTLIGKPVKVGNRRVGEVVSYWIGPQGAVHVRMRLDESEALANKLV